MCPLGATFKQGGQWVEYTVCELSLVLCEMKRSKSLVLGAEVLTERSAMSPEGGDACE